MWGTIVGWIMHWFAPLTFEGPTDFAGTAAAGGGATATGVGVLTADDGLIVPRYRFEDGGGRKI